MAIPIQSKTTFRTMGDALPVSEKQTIFNLPPVFNLFEHSLLFFINAVKAGLFKIKYYVFDKLCNRRRQTV